MMFSLSSGIVEAFKLCLMMPLDLRVHYESRLLEKRVLFFFLFYKQRNLHT